MQQLSQISTIYGDTEKMYRHYSEGKPAPTFTGQACVSLPRIVDPLLVKDALNDIQSRKMIDRELNREHFWGKGGIWNEVEFDQQHQPRKLESFSEYAEPTQTVVQLALQRFGQELKLIGGQKIAASFIRYHIPTQGLNSFGWHIDQYASWTMITMLSDPDDPQTGWSGGDLYRSTFYSSYYPLGFIQPQESIQCYKYQQYNAILFHNFNVLHQVSAMFPRKHHADRIILKLALYDSQNEGMLDRKWRYIDTFDEQTLQLKIIANARF